MTPEQLAADNKRLRQALIEIGRQDPRCVLHDDVSTDFLMLLPAELAARSAALIREENEACAAVAEAEKVRCEKMARLAKELGHDPDNYIGGSIVAKGVGARIRARLKESESVG